MSGFFDSVFSFFEMIFEIVVGTFDNLKSAFDLFVRASGFLANIPNYVPNFLQICIALFVLIGIINWWLSKQ